ncbi:hypothetical protein LINPERHAP1_LOCUS4761, partial [Linum perenne]
NNQNGYVGYRNFRQQGNYQDRPPYNAGANQNHDQNHNSRPASPAQDQKPKHPPAGIYQPPHCNPGNYETAPGNRQNQYLNNTYTGQQHQNENNVSELDKKLSQIITRLDDHDSQFKAQALLNQEQIASGQRTEQAVNHISSMLASGRPFGQLPSQTEPNPRKEQAKMVSVQEPTNSSTNASSNLCRTNESPKEAPKEAPKEYDPPLALYYVKPPFPRALLPNARIETGMWGGKEGYPAARSKKPSSPYPAKCFDPGSFTLPLVINDVKIEHSLVDLGTSVNVMPMSLFEKLNLGELAPTSMQLVFADRSLKTPRGEIKDVVTKCGPFTFLADYVIIDTSKDDSTILIGRPFMATTCMQINVPNGSLTLRVGKDTITFRLKDGMKYTPLNEESHCLAVETVELTPVNSVTDVSSSVPRSIVVSCAEQITKQNPKPSAPKQPKKKELKASSSPPSKEPSRSQRRKQKKTTQMVWRPVVPPPSTKPAAPPIRPELPAPEQVLKEKPKASPKEILMITDPGDIKPEDKEKTKPRTLIPSIVFLVEDDPSTELFGTFKIIDHLPDGRTKLIHANGKKFMLAGDAPKLYFMNSDASIKENMSWDVS